MFMDLIAPILALLGIDLIPALLIIIIILLVRG